MGMPASGQGKLAEAEPYYARGWRSAAACWARSTRTRSPPSITWLPAPGPGQAREAGTVLSRGDGEVPPRVRRKARKRSSSSTTWGACYSPRASSPSRAVLPRGAVRSAAACWRGEHADAHLHQQHGPPAPDTRQAPGRDRSARAGGSPRPARHSRRRRAVLGCACSPLLARARVGLFGGRAER